MVLSSNAEHREPPPESLRLWPPSQKTREWMAVLSSARIPYHTEVKDGRTCIIVTAHRRDDVLALLGEFEEESVDWPPQLVEDEGEGQFGMMLSILVCLGLMIFLELWKMFQEKI